MGSRPIEITCGREMPSGSKINQSDQGSTVKPPRIISSRELLGNDKLVIIRHEQEEYRLHVTAAGKLILTK
jgi:hemin uptake protein HemP